jgi:hypothetical protein
MEDGFTAYVAAAADAAVAAPNTFLMRFLLRSSQIPRTRRQKPAREAGLPDVLFSKQKSQFG